MALHAARYQFRVATALQSGEVPLEGEPFFDPINFCLGFWNPSDQQIDWFRIPRKGDSPYYVPNHEWMGASLRFQQADGEWGPFINLGLEVDQIVPIDNLDGTFTLNFLMNNGKVVSVTTPNLAGPSNYDLAIRTGAFEGTEEEYIAWARGPSAYQVARDQGYVGTEAEWLATLKGDSGYSTAVNNGFIGTEQEWLDSLVGKTAYQVAVSQGFVGTEQAWLATLKGDSAYKVATNNGFVGTESQWLASLRGIPGESGVEAMSGTSSSDIEMTLGEVNLITQSGKYFTPGQTILLKNPVSPNDIWMIGRSVSYVGGALTINVSNNSGGSETYSEWVIEVAGPQGPNGNRGWAPSFAIVADGSRRVMEVTDWIGGEGFKPDITGYLGAAGITNDIAQAVELRGPIGLKGWAPILSVENTPGGKSVLRITDWTGGEGDKPTETGYIGEDGIVGTATLAQDIRGMVGPKGWSPILGAEEDGERRVMKVVDYSGGDGTKPTESGYVGPNGLTQDIAQAVDFRGTRGLGVGDMLEADYDPTGVKADVFSMDNMVETATKKVLTNLERAKLTGIAAEATKNLPDAELLDRQKHTGEQAISTITGLSAALDDKIAVNGNKDLNGLFKAQIETFDVTAANGGDNNWFYVNNNGNTRRLSNFAFVTIPAGGSIRFDGEVLWANTRGFTFVVDLYFVAASGTVTFANFLPGYPRGDVITAVANTWYRIVMIGNRAGCSANVERIN